MFVWIAWTVSNANYNTNQFSAVYPNLSIKSGVLLTNTVLRGSTTGDAGTIADSLLSANIPLLNGNNNFTGTTNNFANNVGFTEIDASSASISNAVFEAPITVTNLAAANTYAKITGIGTISMVVDGGGSVIPTSKVIPVVRLPWNGKIIKATLLSDAASLTGIDIWKTNYSQYPPLVANSIVAAAPPQLASTLTSQDSTLASWVTGFVSNDVFKFTVLSNSAATFLRLDLDVLKQ